MTRSIHKLTPERVKQKAKKPGLYSDGGGLYLRVTPPSACSWIFRYMLRGKAREMGLGSYPEIDLTAARREAEAQRGLKAKGLDPIEEKQRREAEAKASAGRAMKFRDCATAYIESHKEGWKSAKHAQQWTNTLTTYVYPVLGDVAVSQADTALVCTVLEPIWRAKPETASRVRGRIEVILDWARTREYRTGENPARWRGHLENLFPARSTVRRVQHHPALPYDELPAFMQELAEQEGISADALRFTILTAARTDQTIRAAWPEFDLDKAVWTIPGRRMKGKKGREREHRVPLSKPALDILRARHTDTNGHGYVFPGAKPKKPLSNMAMLSTLRRMGRNDITVHGFRSTFRDWVEERTNYAGTVAEAALAHVVEDKVEGAYRRGDLFEKRRKLMAAWGSYCTARPQRSEVVPIRAVVTS